MMTAALACTHTTAPFYLQVVPQPLSQQVARRAERAAGEGGLEEALGGGLI